MARLMRVRVHEPRMAYYETVVEVPDGAGPQDLAEFVSGRAFNEWNDKFDEVDVSPSEDATVFVDELVGEGEAAERERLVHRENSHFLAGRFRGWLEHRRTPPGGAGGARRAGKHLVDVDPCNCSGYVGDGDDGVYYQLAEHPDGLYVSGVVDSNSGHFIGPLFTDEGPFVSEEQARGFARGRALEWCDDNNGTAAPDVGEPTADAVAVQPPGRNERTWVTRDARVIRIVDMSNGHLVNTIRMLERHGDEGCKVYGHLVEEAGLRGLEP